MAGGSTREVKDLNLPASRVPANLDDMTQKGLERLYEFQHGDGGWGTEALPLISKSIDELHALPRLPGGAIRYTPTIVRAWR